MTSSKFTKNEFFGTTIIQSNETFNEKGPRKNMIGFSEYYNLNGIYYKPLPTHQFAETSNYLRHASRLADASHKSIITDLLPYSLHTPNGQENLLISSSWDGTIKVWT